MEKLSKTLLILNLLHHRRVVSASEIKKVCKISDRSLYRYLSAISAAHFPIIFDHKLHGYRLLETNGINISNLRQDERLILLVALNQLSKRVNPFYQQSIDLISGKILSSSFRGLEDIWQAFATDANLEMTDEKLSDLLTSLIIHSAARSGHRLGVNLSTTGNPSDFLTVENPSLLFSDGWKITGKGIDKAVSLDSVEQVFSY
jgi:predicted DNA-binding transcriptional regulator YafY